MMQFYSNRKHRARIPNQHQHQHQQWHGASEIRRRIVRVGVQERSGSNINHHQSRRNSGLGSIFLYRVIFLVAIFSSAQQHPQNRARASNNSMFTVTTTTMVSSLSMTARTQWRPRAFTSHFLKRSKTSRLQCPLSEKSFRLYSNLDNFLEGGEIDLLVEELSATQQQQEELSSEVGNTKSTGTESGGKFWRDALDLSFEKNRDEQNISHRQISSPSPVEVRTIWGRTVHVKHDDQLRLMGSGISGNKARKMWTLNEIPAPEFPRCLVSYGGPQSNSMLALAAVTNSKNRELVSEQMSLSAKTTPKISMTLESLGDDEDQEDVVGPATTYGNGQNAENDTALPIRFVYFAKKLPRFLRKQPNGNIFRALSLGMELVEVSQEEYRDLFEHRSDEFEGEGRPPRGLEAPGPDSLWVPQGGAFAPAQVGAQRLAQEIFKYWSENGNDRSLTVCVPGGTCTTAVLLHHGLKQLLVRDDDEYDDDFNGDSEQSMDDFSSNKFSSTQPVMDIEVVVVPCVGDAAYARRQMRSLSAQIGASPNDIPTILQPEPDESLQEGQSTDGTIAQRKRYFTFGKPNKKILETFQELQDEFNLVVDLIYGAPSFAIMRKHWGDGGNTLSPDLFFDPNQPLEGREIMYVHSGGLEGINSQLLRYRYDGLVEIKDVQLPGRKNRSKHKKKK